MNNLRQTKITEVRISCMIEENICRLHITMDDLLRMSVIQRFGNRCEPISQRGHLDGRQSPIARHEPIEEASP